MSLGRKTLNGVSKQQNVYLVRITPELAEQWRVWSDPVQIMVEPVEGEPCMVELVVREWQS